MSVVPVSSGLPLPGGGLPVVNQTLEPAWVRKGSASTQKAYESALAFEEMLVEQLSKSLTAGSGLGGESGQEGEAAGGEGGTVAGGAAPGPISSMLPQALTSAVMSDGGLGLAAQMTRPLQDGLGTTTQAPATNIAPAAKTQTPAAGPSGGTSAGEST